MTATTSSSAMEFGRPAAAADDPYLVVENLTVQFPTHDGLVQAVIRPQLHRPQRPDPGHRGGVRIGQVGVVDGGARAAQPAVHPAVRLDPGRRHRGHRRRQGHPARAARQRRRDDLPGPAHRAAPVLLGREADRRGRADAQQRVQGRSPPPGHRDARPGRHPAGRSPGRRLPAPVLRRACGNAR